MSKGNEESWRCMVCGYVHRGSGAPDWCPVCGAAKADFESLAEEAPPAPREKARQWRCLNCNYVHLGGEPCATCPVCGAPEDRFEALFEEKGAGREAAMARRVIVAGAGIAGVSAVEALRQASPGTEITLVSREQDLPYFRLNLTRYLAGEVDESDLPVHPEAWYGERNVTLRLNGEISSLSLVDRTLELRGGERLPFDKLILTVGAHPFIPPFPGAQREGVFSLRTRTDANRILEAAKNGAACVCIGGGILGIETAGALARRGVDVTLLEGHRWLMPRQLNSRAGEMLMAFAAGKGIRIRTQARTEEIQGDERVAGVLLEDKSFLPADLVVITTGIRPNSHLARRAGLEINKGLVVNNHLETSHPDVLAAGDVAEHRGVLYGNWSASQYQGNIAGMNAQGLDVEFGGIPRSNMLKVLGLEMLSIGQYEPEDGSFQVIEDESNGTYRRFVFRDGCVVGLILLGDTSITGSLKRALESRADLSGLLKMKPSGAEVASHFAG